MANHRETYHREAGQKRTLKFSSLTVEALIGGYYFQLLENYQNTLLFVSQKPGSQAMIMITFIFLRKTSKRVSDVNEGVSRKGSAVMLLITKSALQN